MAAWKIIQSQKYLRERKFSRSSLKYNMWGHLYASRLSCYTIQPSQFFFSLQHPNRLLFSQLNTWWSSWLAFQGHVVQKREREKEKCIFKHLNHTRMLRCSYAENSAGTETKRRNIQCDSPSSRSPGAYALVGRGTDAPTLFTFFLSFSSWQSKWNWVWVWTFYVLGDVAFRTIMFPQKGSSCERGFRALSFYVCCSRNLLWLMEWMSP